jgi:hypothetical protein
MKSIISRVEIEHLIICFDWRINYLRMRERFEKAKELELTKKKLVNLLESINYKLDITEVKNGSKNK